MGNVTVTTFEAEPGLHFDIARCERQPGELTRIALEYDGSWRLMLWLEIRPDGSICLAPRYKGDPGVVRAASKVSRGPIQIEYDEGDELDDPELRRRAKATVHASGLITFTAAGTRTQHDLPLRELEETTMYLALAFQHPGRFDQGDPRKTDVRLNYEFGERRPLAAYLYVSPAGSEKIVVQREGSYQRNVLVTCGGLRDCQDLTAQLVFAHRAEGPWPPHSYIIARGPAVEESEHAT